MCNLLVILLSAKSEYYDKIGGLNSGAVSKKYVKAIYPSSSNNSSKIW